MTECTQSTIPFASLKTPRRRKRIEADFTGGRLTSDAGVLLLREIDQRLGLTETLARCIPDPRDPRFTVHAQQEMLAQRIYATLLGYEDLNDHDTLRHDAAYILMDGIRRLGLQGTVLERAQVDTIRLKLFKIGARVTRSVRRIVFHLASGYPLQVLFREVVSRLRLVQPVQPAAFVFV